MTTVPASVVDTEQMPPHERLPRWREAVATHDVTLSEGRDPSPFRARGSTLHLGTVLLAEVSATAQRMVRSARAARVDQFDHYIVRLQKAGRWTGDVGGRTVTDATGDVVVLDMAHAGDACMTDIENISLVVPRDTLDDVLPPFDMHGLMPRDSMAALLRSHLSELAAHLA